jgi:hypothetical protein
MPLWSTVQARIAGGLGSARTAALLDEIGALAGAD